MLIGQTDMFQTVTALGLGGRVGDQWSMCTFHQGSEKIILQLEAGYKRAVNSSAILFLQNWRGPYKYRLLSQASDLPTDSQQGSLPGKVLC